MKRFDIAIEISKQLISLASALLLGIAALAGNILENEAEFGVFVCLLCLYLFLALSVIAGIVHFGAISNVVEISEKAVHENPNGNREFVSAFDSSFARFSCITQQFFFCAAIIALIVTLLVDRSCYIPNG